jgi:hypothetical protein
MAISLHLPMPRAYSLMNSPNPPDGSAIPRRVDMEATRARFGSLIEWMLAAAFILAAFGIGSRVVRELRMVNAALPVSAREASVAAGIPQGVPGRAVSVPVLLLAGHKEVRVGDTASAIAARLGREAEVGTQTAERATFGERLTRFYEYGGTRFVLVFEPFEQGGEPRVAAIYLQ